MQRAIKTLIASTFLAAFAMTASQGAQAEIIGKEIRYSANGVEMRGYLAVDSVFAGNKRPAVLVVHEWWGHNPYARKRADMLAELGYVALAVDMYGDGKLAEHPKDAGGFAGAVMKNMPEARQRFEAAIAAVQAHPDVDDDKIAAFGYCFGGGVALTMARMGVDLDGVVSFHGSLAGPVKAEKGKVKAEIMVFNGARDPLVKPEQIGAFSQEMAEADVAFTFVNLPNAKHSFTNPDADSFATRFNLPVAYDEEADRRSWKEATAFLRSIF